MGEASEQLYPTGAQSPRIVRAVGSAVVVGEGQLSGSSATVLGSNCRPRAGHRRSSPLSSHYPGLEDRVRPGPKSAGHCSRGELPQDPSQLGVLCIPVFTCGTASL